MGIGPDQPKSNIMNDNEYSEVPIFPPYMEDTHKTWLGFKYPKITDRPDPFVKLENGDVAPYVGLKYILHAYEDFLYEKEIPLQQAMQYHIWQLKGREFEWEDVLDSSKFKIGIKVTKLFPCRYTWSLTYFCEPLSQQVKYWEMKSVTATMNSIFDVFVSDIDRLDAVRSSFRDLVDIRKLER